MQSLICSSQDEVQKIVMACNKYKVCLSFSVLSSAQLIFLKFSLLELV
jgi:hypothetical protein